MGFHGGQLSPIILNDISRAEQKNMMFFCTWNFGGRKVVLKFVGVTLCSNKSLCSLRRLIIIVEGGGREFLRNGMQGLLQSVCLFVCLCVCVF